jgi:hypothetical protein
MSAPTFNFKGLWTFVGQLVTRDDVLAAKLKHLNSLGKVIHHGTYTRDKHYRVMMSARDGVDDAVLDIVDEDANLVRFVWDGDSAWVAATETVVLASESFASPGLVLTAFGATNANWPRNGTDDGATPCPLKPAAGQLLPTQKIVGVSGTEFHWIAKAAGSGTELNLQFSKPSPQSPADPSLPIWGDQFKNSVAQNDFPYLGFNPRKMELYTNAGQITSAGTKNDPPPANPHQESSRAALAASAALIRFGTTAKTTNPAEAGFGSNADGGVKRDRRDQRHLQDQGGSAGSAAAQAAITPTPAWR